MAHFVDSSNSLRAFLGCQILFLQVHCSNMLCLPECCGGFNSNFMMFCHKAFNFLKLA